MSDASSKKANSYLEGDSFGLQTVFNKIKALAELNESLKQYLDKSLIPYCQVANITGNRLVLIVANGSVATQIRFQTPDLINKFKTDARLQKITDIQCKVRPADSPMSRNRTKTNKMQPLSKDTAEIIRQSAESLSDPTLREIMQRIAKHVKE